MKKISILGSTGSIGQNALDVIRTFPDRFQVIGLAAGKNLSVLANQIAEFKPAVASVREKEDVEKLFTELKRIGSATRNLTVLDGIEGAVAVATHPDTHLVLSAMSGSKGLIPTLRSIEAGKTLAIANKETLVMAGGLIREKAKQFNVTLIPVDSEHNAIHQCLRGESRSHIRRLILTASGGPFFGTDLNLLERVTPAQALAHPRWKMGRKISIDSATLMNKGLEIIEASCLFEVTADEIEVVIHPQSTVHSLVEMIDGSIIGQLGLTDMRIAIQYALAYPDRCVSRLPSLDLKKMGNLEFFEPDLEKFPCLALGYKSLRIGGTMPIVVNAANEIAVDAFLEQEIKFTDIPKVIESTMQAHVPKAADSIETILQVDHEARETAQRLLSKAMIQHI